MGKEYERLPKVLYHGLDLEVECYTRAYAARLRRAYAAAGGPFTLDDESEMFLEDVMLCF